MADGIHTQETRSICQRHHDQWLQHYKPTRCAACPVPLASAARPCPEWLREELQALHGAFVHLRPCYLEAVARRKQKTNHTSEPMETEEENIPTQQTNFQIDVSDFTKQILASTRAHGSCSQVLFLCLRRQTRMEETTRNYLTEKLMHLSPLKRKADAAATTPIPLTTTHGGHSMHVLIVSRAEKAFDQATAKQKKQRTQTAELLQRITKPPPPPIPPTPKLTPIEGLQFRQLRGQFTNTTLRSMRSYLNSKHCNFLPSENKLRSNHRRRWLVRSTASASSSVPT